MTLSSDTLSVDNLSTGSQSPDYIYAIGGVKPYFPSQDMEKQYDAAAEVVDIRTPGFADVFNYSVSPTGQSQLSYRPFLYLAEQAIWIFTINGVDTYRLNATTPTQLNALIKASGDTSGSYILLGSLATGAHSEPSDFSSGLPIVSLAHLMEQSTTANGNESETIVPPLKSNIGKSSVERAVNYFLINYETINADENGNTIVKKQTGMEFNMHSGDGNREIVEFILTCPDRSRFASSIDVTDQYPFVSSPMSPFSKS